MSNIWVGPENGEGQIIDFGMSKSEIETRRSEVSQALKALESLSEISTVYVTEVCENVGIDAYPLISAVERLRNVSDATILKLEEFL